jgi:pimeloyl-ACP methyl ester carboxylesterase
MDSHRSNCLPYLLAAEGFDVWVGNNRGNRISQTPGRYHNYNIDDLVQFDQPAIINGVLAVTDKKKVIYVGHSQGSTQFLLAVGEQPALREKVAAFVGLGTIVSLSGVTENKPMNLLARIYFFELLQFMGFSKLLLISRWMSQAIGVTMYNSGLHLQMVMRGIKQLVGCNGKTIPEHMIGVIFTHEPGGGSVNNVLHWMQCFRSKKRFRKFCYGRKKNLQLYGDETPPEYCLSHLKELPFPCFLFRGEKDGLASHEDFTELVGLFNEDRVLSV